MTDIKAEVTEILTQHWALKTMLDIEETCFNNLRPKRPDWSAHAIAREIHRRLGRYRLRAHEEEFLRASSEDRAFNADIAAAEENARLQ